jgi:hypothetical protein
MDVFPVLFHSDSATVAGRSVATEPFLYGEERHVLSLPYFYGVLCGVLIIIKRQKIGKNNP